MTTYTPQPGTIPYRVITWLKLQPTGAEFTSAQLCEELEILTNTISASLEYPLKHGAVQCYKGSNGLMYWSLGTGKPEPLPEDFEPDEPLNPRGPVIKRPERTKKAKAKNATLSELRAGKEPAKEATGVRLPVFLQDNALAAAGAPEPDIASAVSDWDKHYIQPGAGTLPDASTRGTTPARTFRVGTFSDGSLILERGAYTRFEVSKDEAKVLMDFLFDLAGAAA